MRVFNVFKNDRFWSAEDGNLHKGIVRGPVKELVVEKAIERALKEKCSKVVIFDEDGSVQEEIIGKEC